jgi:hypothetical protein
MIRDSGHAPLPWLRDPRSGEEPESHARDLLLARRLRLAANERAELVEEALAADSFRFDAS